MGWGGGAGTLRCGWTVWFLTWVLSLSRRLRGKILDCNFVSCRCRCACVPPIRLLWLVERHRGAQAPARGQTGLAHRPSTAFGDRPVQNAAAVNTVSTLRQSALPAQPGNTRAAMCKKNGDDGGAVPRVWSGSAAGRAEPPHVLRVQSCTPEDGTAGRAVAPDVQWPFDARKYEQKGQQPKSQQPALSRWWSCHDRPLGWD